MLICPECHKGKFPSEWGSCLAIICKECQEKLDKENEEKK